MNLKEIRSMIGSIVDYDPQVDSYKSEVNRIVNEVYDDFFGMHPWQWSQAEVDQYTVPDVDLGTITLTTSTVIPVKFIANTANFLTYRHEGSILTIHDAPDKRDNGEYIIDKCDFDNGNNLTYVSKLAKAANKIAGFHAAGQARAVVLQRYLPLPADCNEPISIGVRNQAESGTDGFRHFYQLTKRQDEELNLRLDVNGQPTEWIAYSQFPEKVTTVADFAPFPGDLVVSSIATGAGTPWPEGTYEFKFCYVFRGQEGPLSEPIEFVNVGAANNLRFVTRDTTLGLQFGIRKKIYVRLKNINLGGGVFYSDEHFRDLSATILPDDNAAVNAGSLGTQNIPYFIIDDDNTSLDYPNAVTGLRPGIAYLKSLPRAPDNSGSVWQIRLNPHPAGEREPIDATVTRSATNAFIGYPVRLRYNKRFYSLANDADMPQCPPDVHRYIVYAACAELFMKHKEESQALFYTKKAADELAGARKRHLTTRAGPYIKAAYNVGPIYGEAFRKLNYKP